MSATFLPEHASNPLEAASSDRHLKSTFIFQGAVKREREARSSDDPLNSFNALDPGSYRHPAPLLLRSNLDMSAPRSASRTIKREWHDRAFVDLDEESDDEDAAGGGGEAEADMGEEVDMMDDFGGEGEELEVEAEAEEVEEMEQEEDAQGETDEEMTIHLKPPEEQEEIAEEIADLQENVPELVFNYKVIDRLGTGTFSSVYKAIDLHYHTKWDNTAWQGSHPTASSARHQATPRPPDAKVFVAVKRIYVTSGPERIRNEITIMEDCRGCRHVSQLITAFRNRDQVVAIMPYHRHEDFRVRCIL